MARLSTLFLLTFGVLALVQLILADFFYNQPRPKVTDLDSLDLKCVPRRTIIKIQDKQRPDLLKNFEEYDENEVTNDFQVNSELELQNVKDDVDKGFITRASQRRHHMNFATKDESCKVCVCSDDGKAEYCSRRPARNVNECLRIAKFKKEFQKGVPFDHERDLTQRIRRDLIWHRDEIPYAAKSKCYRGTTFYTNNPNANDTDIDLSSDFESFLNYTSKDNTICYACVCSVSGRQIACIDRSAYYCDYFRSLNRDEHIRDDYYRLFGEDRPSYFTMLSYRLRRTMDDGLYDVISNVGTGPNSQCIPFVSEYTDCSDENRCTGCTRCSCTSRGTWLCNKVYECPRTYNKIDHTSVNHAFNTLLNDIKTKQNIQELRKPIQVVKQSQLLPQSQNEDLLLDNEDLESKIVDLFARKKREIKNRPKNSKESKKKSNDTDEIEDSRKVKFYHTVDEINEDTIKASNQSGTIQAAKIDMSPIISRRTDVLSKESLNASLNSPLLIEYGSPHENVHNKIDENYSETDLQEKENIGIIANHTLEKDKDLSKLVVNELNKGQELIGDRNGPIMSNITFTPVNDTLTAMAFIAGNLLNKLWSMEKDSSDESMEIEAMKTEKIQDLLDLFKEPLTMRQETFLKNALDTLSKSIEKNKDTNNISLCETITDAKKLIDESMNVTWEKSEIKLPKTYNRKNNNKDVEKNNSNVTMTAIEKLNNVLSLIKKYENVHKNLNGLKKELNNNLKGRNKGTQSQVKIEESLSEDDTQSLNLFGALLEKITKLLLPYKAGKKMANKIRNLNIFSNQDKKIKDKLKDMFKIDVSNLSLTTKDKTILDYLIKIKYNPRSLLDDVTSDENITSNIESDILINLSEFFKIKSFVDLMKLVGEKTERSHLRSGLLTTGMLEVTTEIAIKKLKDNINSDVENLDAEKFSTNSDKIRISTTEKPKLVNAKDKLKSHLKTILEDLVELQKESGTRNKEGELRITNALPCIFNILKADNELNTPAVTDKSFSSFEKISKALEEMKKEFNYTAASRRMADFDLDWRQNAAKSGLVWDRVVGNINKQLPRTFRRNLGMSTSPPFEKIKQKIDSIEATKGSDAYKAFSTISQVAPADQKMLLKAMHLEVQSHLEVLKDIQTSFGLIAKLPSEKREDVMTYIEESASNVNLNKKVLNNLEKAGSAKKPNPSSYLLNVLPTKEPVKVKEKLKLEPQNHVENLKLTRYEVLNQLIKNRVTLYLKMKRGKSEDDSNYNIAKTILQSLDSGNFPLAKQLYKIFVTNKKQNSVDNKDVLVSAPVPSSLSETMAKIRHQSILDKEPLIPFEDPKIVSKQLQTARRSQLLRNLLNSKNF